MKKQQTVFLLALIVAAIAPSDINAQNVQVHYDFGHSLQPSLLSERPSLTTTVEHFQPDGWGSTFFFIDLDYYSTGIGGAYWEISRELTFHSSPTRTHSFAAHVEYNGGLASPKHITNNTHFQHAVLAGPAWNWHSADFSRTFSVQALYKYYFRGELPFQRAYSSCQLTEAWGLTFAHGLCTFSGYCDIWYNKNVNGNLMLLSEPQLWFHLSSFVPEPKQKTHPLSHLSIGTEVEISNNFVFTDEGRNNRFFAIPTIAAKWQF